MVQSIFVQGNEALGWGALQADCLCFFGYPITPQNETTEWFARELPKRGKVFLQAESETVAINMLYGAAATGARALTSTSGPGWGLMQETMSHLANAELPCVIVLVQRGGPGQGTTRHAQMDYFSATRGGGHGGYRNIVLAPASVQETHDLVQLAFHLADKYRNPVVLLTDAIIGQMAEPVELRALDLGSLPEKDWVLRGRVHHKDGQPHMISCAQGQIPWPPHGPYLNFMEHLEKKYRTIATSEVRYESYRTEDAILILVAYGYAARVAKEAVNEARSQNLKVGLLRPITLWPFPYETLKEKATQGVRFLVVEDSLGQMLDDVKLGVEGRAPIHFLGTLARHSPTDSGAIFPDRILAKVGKIYD